MKNMKYNICTVLMLLALCGCDMERDMVTTLSKEQINSQYELVRGQCAALYNDLLAGYFTFGNGMEASACDESDLINGGEVQTVNTGMWNQYTNPDEVLSRYYKAIRNVNDFLNPEVPVDLEAYRLDPASSSQAIYKERMAEIRNWNYEARFLRAFYYFELIKRYGGVPIITEPLTLDTDFASIQRNTLKECIDFIVSECDSVSAEGALPAVCTADNLGRATKGAALALKSRVLLYAASDLWNMPEAWASGYSNPELISIVGGDRQKQWKAAADAAKAVIDLTEAGYQLDNDYGFIGKSFQSKELIFVRRANASNDFEKTNFPVGIPEGKGQINPSQNLVDLYEMRTGEKFDWSNPQHAQNPYYNRDPRLDYTIFHNESQFNNKGVLEIYEGGAHGKGIPNATGTGYYIKKFVDETLDLVQNRTSVHTWIFFRMAEIYLNYAEALNECEPGNTDILIYANKTRERSGVEMPPITETNQAQVRERIRNERSVELAFEGHRLWDLRRWMTAVTELNKPLRGVSCKYEDYEYKYTVVEVEKRVFRPEMYFYPIPQSLLYTTGNKWVQNPGWGL